MLFLYVLVRVCVIYVCFTEMCACAFVCLYLCLCMFWFLEGCEKARAQILEEFRLEASHYPHLAGIGVHMCVCVMCLCVRACVRVYIRDCGQ